MCPRTYILQVPSVMLPISYIIYNPVSSAVMTMCIESALDTFHKPIFKVNLFVFAGQLINSATRPTRTCPTSHSSQLTPHNFILQSVSTSFLLNFIFESTHNHIPVWPTRRSPNGNDVSVAPSLTRQMGPVPLKVCPGSGWKWAQQHDSEVSEQLKILLFSSHVKSTRLGLLPPNRLLQANNPCCPLPSSLTAWRPLCNPPKVNLRIFRTPPVRLSR